MFSSGAQRAPGHFAWRSLSVTLLLIALFAFAPALAGPTRVRAGTVSPKVAIIVGPAGSDTAADRTWAAAVAREAARYTPNVVTISSPNATWSRVKAAVAGASIVVYIGRGRGFPSPYSRTLLTGSQDGFGLNPVAGGGNSKTRYYGEAYIRTLRLAPRAAVLLVRLSYASGRGEPGAAQPTLSVARRRVDNYGAGFLAAGASAVIVEASTPAAYYVRAIFTQNRSLGAIWQDAPSYHGHVTGFSSTRVRGAIGRTDPIKARAGFTRSIVGWPATLSSVVRGAAGTDPTPTPTPAPPGSTPTPTPPGPTPAPTPTPTPAASCGTTLQARITAAAAGAVLNLTGCTYTAGATVPKPLTILGGTIRPVLGTPGLVITASDVTVDGLRVVGPQSTTYHKDEAGIEVEGTAAVPIRNLVVRNCEVGNLGYGGIYARHAVNLVIENNRVYDGVYAGIMVVSGQGGRISGNTVQRIGVVGAGANGNNAYGIALSRGGGDLTADPRSSDITVSGNTVSDVPTWHAFDTHGGQRITWTGNTAQRSRFGFFITESSGASGSVRALDNDVNGNTVVAPAGATQYAVTSVYSTGGYVRNNVITGWPAGHEILTSSGSDPASVAINLTISGNTFAP